MHIGALGDIHGAFDTVELIMTRHADVPLWVCVGDVASNDGEYFVPPAPLYFIKGNNEDLDGISAAAGGRPRGRRRPAGADAPLPVQRRAAPGGAVARRRARRHLCPELVQ